MKQNIETIDDGMLHKSIIVDKRLIVLRNPFIHLKISDPGVAIQKGLIAVEGDEIENEGGHIFGVELAKFHGEIVIVY